ncbi:MAG: hypothetical protein RL619_2360 [Bacteroidota bacterium]|jgi:hypothetical protein
MSLKHTQNQNQHKKPNLYFFVTFNTILIKFLTLQVKNSPLS